MGSTNLQRKQNYLIILIFLDEIWKLRPKCKLSKNVTIFFFLSEKTETHQKTPSNQESATSSKTSKEEEKVTEVGKEEWMEKDPLCISKHNIFVRVHNFGLMFIIWFYEFLISKSQISLIWPKIVSLFFRQIQIPDWDFEIRENM